MQHGKALNYDIINFSEFLEKYKNNPDFKEWLLPLERLLLTTKFERGSPEYNIVSGFLIFLIALVDCLDPALRRNAIIYGALFGLRLTLDKKIFKRIERTFLDLKNSGNSDMIDFFKLIDSNSRLRERSK